MHVERTQQHKKHEHTHTKQKQKRNWLKNVCRKIAESAGSCISEYSITIGSYCVCVARKRDAFCSVCSVECETVREVMAAITTQQ